MHYLKLCVGNGHTYCMNAIPMNVITLSEYIVHDVYNDLLLLDYHCYLNYDLYLDMFCVFMCGLQED